MVPILNFVNSKYVYSAISIIFLFGVIFGAHLWDKQRAVSLAVKNVELVYKARIAEANQQKAEMERELQKVATLSKSKTDEKINSITKQRDNALRSLQQRSSRETSASAPLCGCSITGAQLSREDAEFLTREAARAEKVREERDYYYNEYENARQALERYGQQRKDAR